MKAALCDNIILFVDISYVCSLDSITPPVKEHVMTLNVLVIVDTNFATNDLVFDSIVANGCNSKQNIVCRFDYWEILLCRNLALV